jgi:RNA recognition motif-containing protein
MNTKIFVDNLAANVTEKELMDLFSAFGNVSALRIASHRNGHKPRCVGFVTMMTSEGALAAIQALNGTTFGTGTLSLSEQWPKELLSDTPNARGPRRVNVR